MDSRPFHDHGSWKGPCSKERHAAIVTGIRPFKSETPEQADETAWKYAISASRVTADGTVICACCREPFLPKVT